MSSEYQETACVGCGGRVMRWIPDELRGHWREFALSREQLCDACDEAGQRTAEQEAEVRDRIAAHRAAEHRLKTSGLPDQLRTASCATLNGDQPVEDAQRWAAGELRGLLLSGPVGAGKTHAAAAAAVKALRSRPVVWCSVPALLAQLGADRRDPRHQQALDALLGRAALVLDDLDKARPTDYGAEQIFAAIDGRTTAGRQLLITTNLELGEIATRYPQPYGEGIASRLAGYCTWHRLTRADRRMDAA